MTHVKLYTTHYCPFCRSAKALLQSKNADFEEIYVDGDTPTRLWLEKTTGRRTVPQIFIGEAAIGGFEELKNLDDKGELDSLLGSRQP